MAFPGRVVLVHGLEEAVGRAVLAARRARARHGIGDPVHVLVPSAGVRVSVQEALLGATGGAVAGIEVLTPWVLAERLGSALGIGGPEGDFLVPVAAARALARTPELVQEVGAFERGAGLLVPASRDLLSAGLLDEEGATPEAVLEAAALGPAERARAVALIAFARRFAAEARALGRRGIDDLLVEAAAALARGESIPGLPAEVVVCGFSDATGRLIRFLRALAARIPATLVLAWSEARLAPGVPFAESWPARFLRRLGAPPPELPEPGPPPPPARLLLAASSDDETEAVAEAIAAEVAAGVPPEEILAVVIEGETRAAALALALEDRGVPLAPLAADGGAPAALRSRRACLQLLRTGPDAPLSCWFSAAEEGASEEALLAQPRLVDRLRELGVRTVADLASPALEESLGAEGTEERLLALVRTARAWLAAESDPVEPAFRARAASARRLLAIHPGKGPSSVLAALESLAGARCAAASCDEAEFLAALDAAAELPAVPLAGGRGAGVRILDAASARGIPARRLFVLGLTEAAFPRAAAGDPWLCGAAREALQACLPALHAPAEREAEERELAAGWWAGARGLTLSAALRSESNEPMRLSPAVLAWERAGRVRRVPVERGSRPRGASALLLQRAREGHRGRFAEALLQAGPAARWGFVLQALSDLDFPPGSVEGYCAPSPRLGFVGAAPWAFDDPTGPSMYVTPLQDYADCPWRFLLRRGLRLAAPPSAFDVGWRIDARSLGTAVHRALDLLATAGHPPPFPSGEVEAAVDSGLAGLREGGSLLPGMRKAFREAVAARVALALRLWEEDPGEGPVGAELEGVASISGLHVRFRADRVDRVPGGLRLVDYKTGRLEASSAEASIARGAALQLGVYASAEGVVAAELHGLHPDAGEKARRRTLDAGSPAVVEQFPRVVGALLGALEAGAFVPRLEDPTGSLNRACEFCEVRLACVIGDSRRRRRAVAILEWGSQGAKAPPDVRAMASAWSRGQPERPGEEDEDA